MTITSTALTTNSWKISVSNELSSSNLIAEVHTKIQALGWTLYDTILNSVPGTGARGAGAVVSTVTGSGAVSSLTVTTAGRGYSKGDILQVVDGSHANAASSTATFQVTGVTTGTTQSTPGSGATATWTTVSGGAITGTVTIGSGGSGYIVGDTVRVSGAGNGDAILTVATVSTTAVATWTLTSGGTGYVTTAVGATTLPPGAISSTSQISGGSGYASNASGLTPTCVGNIYSPMTTYVYRAANADGATYKYLIMRWNPLRREFHTSTCESWDLSTKLPTNESWTNQGNFPHGYDLKDSFIWIGGTVRNITIWSFIRNEPGLWSMVMEFERITGEDLASKTYPCFAWTNSLMIGTPFGKAANTTQSTMMMAFPRTPENQIGASAVLNYTPTTSRQMWPPNYPSATLTYSALTSATNLAHLADAYNTVYGWDNTKTYTSPITINHRTKNIQFGRVYNLSVTGNLGNALDTATLKLDSSGGWASSSGSSSPAVLLPMNGGSEVDCGAGTNKSTAAQSAALTYIIAKGVPHGTNLWLATSDGVRIWDMTGGTGSSPAATIRSEASGVTDIIFDGKQTMYCATSAGVVAIDTENTATQTLISTTNGAAYLSIDEKNVYASARTASTLPVLYIISRAVPASNGTLFSTATLAAVTGFTTLTSASGFGTPVPDYQGGVFVFNTAGVATANLHRWAKFDATVSTTATQNFHVTDPIITTSTATNSHKGVWIDYTSGQWWYIHCNNTSLYIYPITQFGLTFNTSATFYPTLACASVASGQLLPSTTPDYRGDLSLFSFRGHLMIAYKAVGRNTGCIVRVLFDPSASIAGTPTVIVAASTTAVSTTVIYGGSSWYTTDHVRLFTPAFVTANTDNRVYYYTNNYSLRSIIGNVTGRLLVKG